MLTNKELFALFVLRTRVTVNWDILFPYTPTTLRNAIANLIKLRLAESPGELTSEGEWLADKLLVEAGKRYIQLRKVAHAERSSGSPPEPSGREADADHGPDDSAARPDFAGPRLHQEG